MKLLQTTLIMFLLMFLIQYFMMSYIMVYETTHIKRSLGKLYLSLAMGFAMALVEVVMYDLIMPTFSTYYYVVYGGLLYSSIHLYRNQFAILEKDYLNEMIEHHSMAIFTSKAILKKTNNDEVIKIANDIIITQEKEIELMTKLVDKKAQEYDFL